jgi:hypothetical protein
LAFGAIVLTIGCKKNEEPNTPIKTTSNSNDFSAEKIGEMHNVLVSKFMKEKRSNPKSKFNKMADDGVISYSEGQDVVKFLAKTLVEQGYDSTKINNDVKILSPKLIEIGVFKQSMNKSINKNLNGEPVMVPYEDYTIIVLKTLKDKGEISEELFNDLKMVVDSSNGISGSNKKEGFAVGTGTFVADAVGGLYGLLIPVWGSIVYGAYFSILAHNLDPVYIGNAGGTNVVQQNVKQSVKQSPIVTKIEQKTYSYTNDNRYSTVFTSIYKHSSTIWSSSETW